MKKILIIDDEVNVALLLSKFLTRNGFDITTAATGSSGLEFLKNGSFDLVLCDFRLEDTDGREGVADGGFEVEVNSAEAGGPVFQEERRGGGDSGEDKRDEVCAEVRVGFASQGQVTNPRIGPAG